ncbi:hypothetical protein A8W25_01295 [Streptomyces sp. ERV7]|uniref:condensation domain-containing protein n=1 Tax=Streptomyces sp. ERV7 TaxID=1322334 RepID=UPI0007F3FF24|nr:condensation domain-containing protein [Streptomyces sp. ERV7]OAR26953.1 hypothetical protein A8W25_01295 [Streptomyces sp. ERV7]
MRMRMLLESDVPPGRLVLWRVAPGTVAAAQEAPEHPAPPSFVQEEHLRQALVRRSHGRRQPRWHAGAVEIAGTVAPAALEHALTGLLERHDTLRSGFRTDGTRIHRFLMAPHVIALVTEDAGEFDTSAALCEHLASYFDDAIRTLEWPAYTFAAVLRDSSATLLAAFDHLNSDAYSVATAMREVHELYTAHVEDRPPALEPAASYLDFCAAQRQDPIPGEEVAAAVSHWAAFLSDGLLPQAPIEPDVASGPTPTLVNQEFEFLNHSIVAAFEKWCRRNGQTLFTGLLAALGQASFAIAGRSVFRTIVPLQTRKDPAAPSLGWYINAAPIRFTVSSRDSFESTLADAGTATRAALHHLGVPFERVEYELDGELIVQSAFWTSYLDFRPLPGTRHQKPVEAQLLTGNRSGTGIDLFLNRTEAGLSVRARLPDVEATRGNVAAYLAAFTETVTTFAS